MRVTAAGFFCSNARWQRRRPLSRRLPQRNQRARRSLPAAAACRYRASSASSPIASTCATGPGTDYPTAWVYRRAGLPLEVIKEFEGWRQVRDADGAAGWVLQSFLSGRRTALVLPWEIKQGVPAPKIALRRNDSDRARAVAMIEAGVIANLSSCDGRWCRVNIDKFQGYIEQKKLWGVYEGEVIN